MHVFDTLISFCDEALRLPSTATTADSTGVILLNDFLQIGQRFVTLLQSCMHGMQNVCSQAMIPLFSTSPRQIEQTSFSAAKLVEGMITNQ